MRPVGAKHATLTYVAVALTLSCGIAALAADLQIVDMPAAQQVDLYTQVNVGGSVFVRIVSPSGPACADFWWIQWPFGTVQQLGRHCDFARFDIPGLFKAAAASRLRAGGGSGNLKLGVSTEEKVAASATIRF